MIDALYNPLNADWSPEGSGYIDAAQAVPELATHAQNPLSSESVIPAGYVPRPPDPALGGVPGLTQALGFSTGIRNSRAFRQAFDGRTLVVSNMGAHPVQGPVGYSARTDRLSYGISAMEGSDGRPDESHVRNLFVSMNAGAIDLATANNPNYV